MSLDDEIDEAITWCKLVSGHKTARLLARLRDEVRAQPAAEEPEWPFAIASAHTLTGVAGSDRCVVCHLSLLPSDGGLCDKHKYDEQLTGLGRKL